MDPEKLIAELGLKPHPEGGYYSETYRSAGTIPGDALPEPYGSSRSHSTAIYYLLTADDVSTLHRINSDEIFHFYSGDPVRMLQIHPDGAGEEIVMGPRVDRGERPQVMVPGGTWQGLSLVPGGAYALLGCTVAPGFDFADFELADTDELAGAHPRWAKRIRELARYGMTR
jgi:predicted cupin superfamily sugar epimerase